MMAPLAPVEAGLAQRSTRMREAFRRYLQGLGQEALALGGQFDVVLALPQQPLFFHAVEHLHAEIAGEMIVADPRVAQRRILRPGAHAQVTGARPVISAVSMLARAGSPTNAATMAISGPAFIVRP